MENFVNFIKTVFDQGEPLFVKYGFFLFIIVAVVVAVMIPLNILVKKVFAKAKSEALIRLRKTLSTVLVFVVTFACLHVYQSFFHFESEDVIVAVETGEVVDEVAVTVDNKVVLFVEEEEVKEKNVAVDYELAEGEEFKQEKVKVKDFAIENNVSDMMNIGIFAMMVWFLIKVVYGIGISNFVAMAAGNKELKSILAQCGINDKVVNKVFDSVVTLTKDNAKTAKESVEDYIAKNQSVLRAEINTILNLYHIDASKVAVSTQNILTAVNKKLGK